MTENGVRGPETSEQGGWGVTRHGVGVLLALALAGCGAGRSGPAPLPAPGGGLLAPGLSYRHVDDGTGPWAIDILEVDRDACWSAVAMKASGQAIGRATTSALVQALADTAAFPVIGAVNADFFLFAPPGVPVGPHVSGGRLLTGPQSRPAIWFDAAGMATIGHLAVEGSLAIGADTLQVVRWNRPGIDGVGIFDRGWGPTVDPGPGSWAISIDGAPSRVERIDSSETAIAIPVRGLVVVVDSASVGRIRGTIHSAADVSWMVRLSPVMPREAVGGFPVLITDSVLAGDLDRAGGAGFAPVRHPRTAVGITAGGRRLLLVTVDGRQPGWSVGMTLQELAALLLRLGATDALNLDGGGSTAMVVRRRAGFEVVNRTSDTTGERPVANALAIVNRCR